MDGLANLQTAIHARLIASEAVTSFVPADHILDRGGRPEVFPSIILGEDQAVSELVRLGPAVDWEARVLTLYPTLHLWVRQGGLLRVKEIAAAVCGAVLPAIRLRDGGPLISIRRDTARFMRDPDGLTSHGVLTFCLRDEVN